MAGPLGVKAYSVENLLKLTVKVFGFTVCYRLVGLYRLRLGAILREIVSKLYRVNAVISNNLYRRSIYIIDKVEGREGI
jgi:hypothetical protein